MEEIKTISDLIRSLNACQIDSSCYLDTLRQMRIPLQEFEKFYSWDEKTYSRNSLFENELFEVLLVCFEKGQGSPIHDYYSNEAWITVIQGKMREEKFRQHPQIKKLEKVSSVNLAPGDFSFISGQVGIHRYYNIFESRSVCLCLYSKPIKSWKVYDEKTGEFEIKSTWYNLTPKDHLEPVEL